MSMLRAIIDIGEGIGKGGRGQEGKKNCFVLFFIFLWGFAVGKDRGSHGSGEEGGGEGGVGWSKLLILLGCIGLMQDIADINIYTIINKDFLQGSPK